MPRHGNLKGYEPEGILVMESYVQERNYITHDANGRNGEPGLYWVSYLGPNVRAAPILHHVGHRQLVLTLDNSNSHRAEVAKIETVTKKE